MCRVGVWASKTSADIQLNNRVRLGNQYHVKFPIVVFGNFEWIIANFSHLAILDFLLLV